MRLVVVLVLLVALSSEVQSQDSLADNFAQDQLVIVTSARACFLFNVYLARSYEQRRRGLMHVRSLPAMSGMLFLYEDSDTHSMWMKNTYIPLDILFVRADGSIANIAENTEPLSLKSVGAKEPVNFVLELNAGTAAALGIDRDSRVVVPGT